MPNKLTKFWHKTKLHFIVVSVNLVAFTMGTIFSWPSPALPLLSGSEGSKNNPLTVPIGPRDESWLASINLLGATFGTIFPVFIVRLLGKKITLLISIAPAIVGYLCLICGEDVGFYYAGRFLCGVTMGAGFQLVPVYVAELSPVENRGTMGCYFATLIALGNLYVYLIGPFVSFKIFNVLCLVPPVLCLLLVLLLVPESPYDSVARGDFVKTRITLGKLRNYTETELELETNEISRTLRGLQERIELSNVFGEKALLRSLLISVSMAIFQQLTGINGIIAYMQTIFEEADARIPPEYAPILVSAIQVVATFFAHQFVDRFGRKIMLLASDAVLALALLGLGTFFYLKDSDRDTNSITWLPLLCLITAVVCFNIGLGNVTYVILGEIFPPRYKQIASTITTFVLSLTGFGVTWLFPVAIEHISFGYTFFICGGLTGLGFIVFLVIVPETKGKTFSDIQTELGK